MRLIRRPAFLAAIAITILVTLYLGLVAQRAVLFMQSPALAGKAMGVALLVLPAIGVWFLVNEWRLGTTVERMAAELERQGRLPVNEGERKPSGRLTSDAAEHAYDLAVREIELAPEDWVAWFHMAYAYEAGGQRRDARKCLRHAADLFRAHPHP
jgi:tetratricopeptide (TPR) repeat protein